jgi:hypothetical protein
MDRWTTVRFVRAAIRPWLFLTTGSVDTYEIVTATRICSALLILTGALGLLTEVPGAGAALPTSSVTSRVGRTAFDLKTVVATTDAPVGTIGIVRTRPVTVSVYLAHADVPGCAARKVAAAEVKVNAPAVVTAG